jgi:hypothetical protein
MKFDNGHQSMTVVLLGRHGRTYSDCRFSCGFTVESPGDEKPPPQLPDPIQSRIMQAACSKVEWRKETL